MANGAPKQTKHRGERSRLPAVFAQQSGVSRATLALALTADGSPPTEFRLFVSGWNTTEKGDFLFDQAAADATLAAYQTWGVDLMIDLEHQSLDPATPPEPTAKDARGWCNLELRDDGSLWAVNATWTPDGNDRLTQKRQRYVSPAFGFDEDRRVTQILNVAITAMPATHNTPALMAASTTSKVAKMSALNPKLVQAALEAVAAKDSKTSLVVLQQILGALLGSSSADDTDEAPPSSANGGPPDSSAAGGTPPADPPKDSMAAAGRMAMIMTGKNDPGEAMAELARRSKVAVDLESREATLATDRKALESGERRALVGTLVKLGVEIPATAWSDDAGTVPCARLTSEPIADLRSRVEKLSAAGVKPRGPHTPPAGESDVATGETQFVTPKGTVMLSARELAMCAELKVEPKVYAADKAGKKKS